jgi:hypothetical protein
MSWASTLKVGLRGTKLVFRGAVFRRYPGCTLCRQHGPQRKKLVPAGRASHGRQPQQAPHSGGSSGDFLRGDSLQVQVAADAASRVKKMPKRYRSRVEARLTNRATPGNDTDSAEQIFGKRPPARTPTSRSLTCWTVHRRIPEGPLRKRIGDGCCFGKRLSPPSHLTTYNGNRHGRLHSRSRPRRRRNKITEAGYLAQPISRLRHHHALSGIHFRVSKNRHAGLRHHHHPIHAAKGLHRTQGAQDVPARVSRSRHLLRKRGEQDSS